METFEGISEATRSTPPMIESTIVPTQRESLSQLGQSLYNVARKEIEVSIPDSSRLDGAMNYQVWSFRLK
jgi:hypothetical protein